MDCQRKSKKVGRSPGSSAFVIVYFITRLIVAAYKHNNYCIINYLSNAMVMVDAFWFESCLLKTIDNGNKLISTRRLLIVSAIFISAAHGRVVGSSILGAVEDESGAGLAQAVVVIRSVETGAVRTLITEEGGRYAAPSIAVGTYQITASKNGFATQIRLGSSAGRGQSVTVNFRLALGELQQAITVEESISQVSVSTEHIRAWSARSE